MLDAGGVPLLIALLRGGRQEKKVLLHAVAAVQNLTYKNAACCAAVLELGGERVLQDAAGLGSEEIRQFATGTLAAA